MGRKVLVSVIGSHDNDPKVEEMAHSIGSIIANVGAVLVSGGLTGVMEASSKGAQEAGGLTIGLLPSEDKDDANPYVDIALTTSIGFARNAIVACSADIIIALPGSHGTRSEISYGLVWKKPVIDLGNWDIEGMIKVKDIREMETKLNELIQDLNK